MDIIKTSRIGYLNYIQYFLKLGAKLDLIQRK